jgi:predicted Zn-ribbon and HTH transcriptional regulator
MKKELKIEFACVDCKSPYSMVEEEIKFFRDKAFPLPKRCPICRDKRRVDSRFNVDTNKMQYFNNDLRR